LKNTVTTYATSSDDGFLLQWAEQIYHLQNSTINIAVSQHAEFKWCTRYFEMHTSNFSDILIKISATVNL